MRITVRLSRLLPLLIAALLVGCSTSSNDTPNDATPAPQAQPAAASQPEATPPSPPADGVVEATGTVTTQTTTLTPAATPEPSGPAPKIVIPDERLDFGIQTAGKTLSRSFFIRNEGKAPLEIEAVEASCGCTTVDFPKVIQPGKSGKVMVKIETGSSTGKQTKSVTVVSNDPVRPSVLVEMVYTIK